MSYMPLYYDKLNKLDNSFFPNTQKRRNNLSFGYWQRSLFQRACSTLVFDLPETWQGSVKDFFYYCLFRFGFVVVFKESAFGLTFQPCTLKGYNMYYQPTDALVANPALKKDLTLKLGQDAELIKLTPDYMGIWDIIDFYADKLSNLDGGITMSIENSKFAWLLGAKSRPAAEGLKKMLDKISRGEAAVIFDSKLIQDDPVSKDTPFQVWDRKLKENYILSDQLKDLETILYNFDSEVGIPTIDNGQKKERMVVSEAEARTIDSTARSIIWYDTLQSSLKKVNSHFDTDIRVSLRYNKEEEELNTNYDIDEG